MIWLGVMLAAATAAAGDNALAASVENRVRAATEPLLAAPPASPSAVDFHDQVRPGTWTEVWPGADGKSETRTVNGEIWTAAIQAALDRHKSVFLPAREQPYYLDAPIVLSSGCRLLADAKAEIRLKPGTNTCMVRNAHVAGFQDRPVPAELQPDTDIFIQGGVWTTLATTPRESNGNRRGRADSKDSIPGCHGVILLQNVQRVVVRDLTIRASRSFGVHIGTASEFLVENLTFEEHRRDGVHCDGPASFGIIRGIRGKTGDDPVSLLAWDWRNYSASFGPIHHLLVQDVSGAPLAAQSTDAIRLLPGVKRFADGATLDCPITDCVLRNLTDIREFKLYDQPNLELGRDNDFSAAVGALRNIHFQRLTFNRPGSIQIHAETDGLTVRDVSLAFPVASDYRLVFIGPQSVTYKHKPDNPSTWTEIFSPDRDCTVRHLRIENVRALQDGKQVPVVDPYAMVKTVEQKLNPDYPRTTPRGGTGKGIWER
ncbi:MAG: hypothetical protein A3K19_33305 [Lentisphaerae bacterium RIFOXYB12_FULL_65_16]|nr:MAG: hypothetical protein A3K18_05790 [Lentisphaerae bacterium RIFOXYA12_64_32]OGV86910.1 MAG: hypothetical protein A3K19_33305 [Lentisphaerae bacterium RIFOXYB12_FULL_65_16]